MLVKIVRDDKVLVVEESNVKRYLTDGYELFLEPKIDEQVQIDARLSMRTDLYTVVNEEGVVHKVELNQLSRQRELGFKPLSEWEAELPKDEVPIEITAPVVSNIPVFMQGVDAIIEPSVTDKIKEAIKLLDNEDNAHWTQYGFPRAAAVSKFAGFTVSTKQIEQIVPKVKRKEI